MNALRMLQSRHLSVLEAQDVDQFRDRVIRYGRQLGFNTVNALTIVDHSRTHTSFHSVDNTPSAFLETYRNNDASRFDPVMQHCKQGSVPIIWDQDTYVNYGQGELWDDQALYGFKTGIALALHLPGDRHFFIGVDRDKPLPVNSKTLTRVVADLQLFAVHAQEAAFRIFLQPPEPPESRVPLTPRELEALRWTMDGKIASEVGDILNISERTAVFHLNNATRKLGCKSKFQAVLRAITLNLLT